MFQKMIQGGSGGEGKEVEILTKAVTANVTSWTKVTFEFTKTYKNKPTVYIGNLSRTGGCVAVTSANGVTTTSCFTEYKYYITHPSSVKEEIVCIVISND